MSSFREPINNQEVRKLIDALLDRTISGDDFELLDHWITTNDQARELYLDYLQMHQELPDLILQGQSTPPGVVEYAAHHRQPDVELHERNVSRGSRTAAILAIAMLIPIALFVGIYVGFSSSRPLVSHDDAPHADVPEKLESDAYFVHLAHARFFGELPPQIGTSPILKRDYVLLQGMVELGFPNGATAIIEGPASFRVGGSELLALDIGQCSVHAPPGAEGFRVETPEISIVDRGTRFSVNVWQSSETDIQVIEGAADVYRKQSAEVVPADVATAPLRLREKEAMRFAFTEDWNADHVPFDRERYQFGLPDRIISYDVTQSDKGLARALKSITLQRGGRVETIPMEELVPSKVVWFHALENVGYLAGDKELPSPRSSFASDEFLHTGVINIGGSEQPLTTDPVMTIDQSQEDFGTPGMAIQFDRPVRNGPGPDVVLFELQLIMNPLEGDAFHVSPLKFEEGLRSHTITSFDLTMESPESLYLDEVYLYKFDRAPRSLQELETAPCSALFQAYKKQALAVGIDLSDLGYPEGALVEGLFFQDNLADDDHLDPIFIAGLPESDEP
ncbi:FecR domain-containing protein [Bremerella sp. JC770]|uniref:FecR domain-containing protein n=1 Tax=Bremerella sp. JC770 TaxID=3232137 RepID=UPI00345771D6